MGAMEIDFENNELDPVEIRASDVDFIKILTRMMENPDKIQPVNVYASETDMFLSEFFMSFVEEDDEMYIQLEGFSSPDYEKALCEQIPDRERWSIVQPGIYRLRMSS